MHGWLKPAESHCLQYESALSWLRGFPIARHRRSNAAVIQAVGIAATTMISTKMSDEASVA